LVGVYRIKSGSGRTINGSYKRNNESSSSTKPKRHSVRRDLFYGICQETYIIQIFMLLQCYPSSRIYPQATISLPFRRNTFITAFLKMFFHTYKIIQWHVNSFALRIRDASATPTSVAGKVPRQVTTIRPFDWIQLHKTPPSQQLLRFLIGCCVLTSQYSGRGAVCCEGKPRVCIPGMVALQSHS